MAGLTHRDFKNSSKDEDLKTFWVYGEKLRPKQEWIVYYNSCLDILKGSIICLFVNHNYTSTEKSLSYK